jgi:hypothetical protein
MTHLSALELRLHNEKQYLRQAKSEGEKELRRVWIGQIEKEIAGEIEFTGNDLSDEELLAELGV